MPIKPDPANDDKVIFECNDSYGAVDEGSKQWKEVAAFLKKADLEPSNRSYVTIVGDLLEEKPREATIKFLVSHGYFTTEHANQIYDDVRKAYLVHKGLSEEEQSKLEK